MRIVLLLHILAGGLGLISGAVAVYAAKGARLHRRSGRVFVYAMGTMALSGALIAALTGVETSVIMGVFTAYLVLTSLITVRPPAERQRWLHPGLMFVGFAVGAACFSLAVESLMHGESVRDGGMPVPALFIFGTIALLASLSDLRVMRRGGLQGAHRLARHLWRMCFALFIASASFFLGQSDKFPESLRIMPLLAVLALAPLVVLLYWLWRVRVRKTFREPAERTRLRELEDQRSRTSPAT